MSTPANQSTSLSARLKKAAIPAVVTLGAAVGLAGCENAATTVSRNLSEAADNFEINREVVFYNAITSHFFATVVGRCSIEVDAAKDKLDVTCKHGEDDFRKHFLGRAAGVTYFVLQTEGADVSEYHTRITFNPQGFIPDVDFRGDAGELVDPSRPDTHDQPIPQGTQPPVERSQVPAGTQNGHLLPILQGQQPG